MKDNSYYFKNLNSDIKKILVHENQLQFYY